VSNEKWEQLKTLEPELAALEQEIRQVQAEPNFCANRSWYRDFKPRLRKLVGRHSGCSGYLGGPEAYGVAYDHLYNLLPNCSHQGWICL
jgi:hypothetical protein